MAILILAPESEQNTGKKTRKPRTDTIPGKPKKIWGRKWEGSERRNNARRRIKSRARGPWEGGGKQGCTPNG